MNTDSPINDVNAGIPPQANAVSIYGQGDAMDDFPVLKAFQQYVDAEQAKAHKRMMTVCIFFSILMIIVISVFMVIIFGPGRNNSNDLTLKLLEMNQAQQNAAVSRPQADAKAQEEILELKSKLREQELERKWESRLAAQQQQLKDLAAEQKARTVYENLLRVIRRSGQSTDPYHERC